LYGWSEILEASKKYDSEEVSILGLATAFEDFDKNTIENLRRLAREGVVVGETLRVLGERGWLDGNRRHFETPRFRLGWTPSSSN
jgi:hypothetical protein